MLVSDATRIRDADGSPMMNGHNSATSNLGGASKGAGDFGQKKKKQEPENKLFTSWDRSFLRNLDGSVSEKFFVICLSLVIQSR